MAKQVTDVKLRLLLEGFAGLDKIKSSFRDLGKVTDLTAKDIAGARAGLREIAKEAGNTEAVTAGLISAFKGLRTQADQCGDTYQALSADLRELEAVSRGATQSIMAQREAVLASTAASTQNATALTQQRAALVALRAQTRESSTAFDQFSQDIRQVETQLENLADVNRRFNRANTQGTAATAAGAQQSLDAIRQGIALRRQEIATIDLLTKEQRKEAANVTERIRLQQALNRALTNQGILQFQESARAGRERTRAAGRTFNSGTLTAGALSMEGMDRRFGLGGVLPDTTAGLSQELGELNERLINTYRNTETYIAVQLRLAAVQRDVTSATQGFGAALLADLNAGTLIPSQKNLAEVIGQLRREMLELDQTTTEGSRAYAQNATQVRLLEQQLNQLANAYTNVADKARTATAQGTNPFTASGARNPAYAQEQLAELNAALNTADASSLASVDALLDAKRSLYEYEAQVNAQLDQQKDQLAAQDLARVDAQDKKEAAAFQRELNRLDILKQQTAAAREALGFNTQQQLSPLYQQITGLATAGVARQQQFMGRKPSEVLNDIASSFNAGGRGVDLKQRSTEIGGSVAEGVAQGATDSAATAAGAKSFADKLITAYKQAFRIKSPSGESEEKIGVPIGQGIGLGIIKGIEGLKARIQLAIKGVTATPGRAGLPASVGPVSDVADKLQSFLARYSAKTSAFLPLTRLMGEGVTGSAALPLAAYRRSYERGGIVSPSFLPVEERRGLRGTPGIPGAGLEEIIRAEAFKAVSRTGAFVGPLSGPQAAGGAIASAYRAGISPGTFQRPTASGASLPLFGVAAQPAPLQRTMPGMGYQMGGSQFAFPTDGQLGAGRTQSFGRGAANASITEAISTYRKAVDNFWNGETGSFETIRRVVSSGAQLSASKLARNLSETRNTTAALSTAAVQLVSAPGAAFTKLRAGVGQELSEVKATLGEVIQKDLNSVRSGGQKLRQSVSGIGGAVRNVVSPLLGGRYGYLDREREQFEQGFMRPRVTGGAAPPVPPVPPGGGGGGPSPAANNEFTKLNTTLTQFGSLSRRSVTDIRQLGSVLDELRADLSPLDDEYRQVNKSIEAQQVLIERELGRRERRQRRAPSTGQLVQAGGAAISGGIFGGPEGFLGGVAGGVLGTVLPGIGTAGGAFAGAAAGAQVGMFRQQLAGTADYAASIGKLQIALRGVVGSQSAYDAAIRAAAAATRDLNIPQEEATRGLTRLSAAVIGAGGTVADSSFAFRAMSEAIKATGGNAEQVDGALLALTQVFSKGKVSAEELNQIAERLPGTFTLFAQAAGKTGPELQKALEQGQVGLNDLMKFLDLTSKRYGTTALEIAGSSQDAGARLTVAFQAMRLEVGKALQPLGAELQGAFATFIKDITPAVVGSAKAIAAVLSFLTTNDLVASVVQLGAVALAIKGLQAASAGLAALNLASWFTSAATGVNGLGYYAAAATPKVGIFKAAITGLGTALKALLPLAVITITVDVIVKGLAQLIAAREELRKLRNERNPVPGEGEGIGPKLVLNAERRYTGASREKIIRDQQEQQKFVAGLRKQLQDLEATKSELGTAYGQTAIGSIANIGRGLEQENTQAAIELLKEKIGLSEEVLNLNLQGFKTEAEIEKARLAALSNKFPSPADKDGKDKAARDKAARDKARRDAEAAAADQQRLNEANAQAQLRLSDSVFKAQVDFDRKRFELQQELINRERDLRIAALTGVAAETASQTAQFFRTVDELRQRATQAAVDVTGSQRALQNAVFMRSVTAAPAAAGGGGIANILPGTRGGPNINEGVGYGRGRLHAGQDLGLDVGDPIHARMAGEVIKAYRTGFGDAGGAVVIRYEDGRQGTYGHTLPSVAQGQKVAAGQKIATVAPGGQNTHLHYELRDALGKLINPINALTASLKVPAGRQATGVAAQQRRNAADQGDVAIAQVDFDMAVKYKTLLEEMVQKRLPQEVQLFAVEGAKAYNAQSQALRDNVAELEKRQMLEMSSTRQEVIDGELQKFQLTRNYNREIAQLNADLAQKEVLEDPTGTKAAGINARIAATTQGYADQKAALDELTAAQIAFNDAQRYGQDNRIGLGIKEGALAYVESVGTMREATAQLTQNGIKGLEDQLFSLVTTGKANFQEFAAEILKQSARMILQLTIQRVIMQIIGAIGGGGAPASPSAPGGDWMGAVGRMNPTSDYAMGGAFAKNNIVPYAMGGVVSKPTLFKFANGGTTRTGLMGEAGPEAIMPLSRGPNGKLGVEVTGGSSGSRAPVNVTVNVDAGGTSVQGNAGQSEQLGRVISQAVQAELIKQRRPGGLLAAA